ncbi:hypothetical protein N0V85_009498 [Neurospora sp. IMI 360204]|nr:hypothetical protein N0V85_009498 [Neurospora sp. IMI 360204]
MLDRHNIDCTHVSECNSTPYTLVVTKTFKQQEQLMEWKERKGCAEKRFRNFETHSPLTPELRVLLGDQFDRIMGMEDAYPNSAGARRTAPAPAPASRPLASASGHVTGRSRAGASGSSRYTPAPVVGVRRSRSISFGDGVEITDLTDD